MKEEQRIQRHRGEWAGRPPTSLPSVAVCARLLRRAASEEFLLAPPGLHCTRPLRSLVSLQPPRDLDLARSSPFSACPCLSQTRGSLSPSPKTQPCRSRLVPAVEMRRPPDHSRQHQTAGCTPDGWRN
ncbi:unnamed protein product [Ectocarpus fasciculatus]